MCRIKLFHLSYGYLMELCGTDAKRAWEIIDWVKQDYQSQKVPVLLWNCLIRVPFLSSAPAFSNFESFRYTQRTMTW